MDAALPKKLNVFDRFFAAVLRTPPREYLGSSFEDEGGGGGNDSDAATAIAVWTKMCARVGLTAPTGRVSGNYEDADEHYDVRAALVLEEARAALAAGLRRRSRNRGSGGSGTTTRVPGTMTSLSAHYVERNHSKAASSKITFRKRLPFTKEELFNIRPGGVFEASVRGGGSTTDSHFGVVVSAKRGATERSQSFDLVFYTDELPPKLDGTEFVVSPVENLICTFRCFEAMMSKTVRNIEYLLGNKNEDDENNNNNNNNYNYNYNNSLPGDGASSSNAKARQYQASIGSYLQRRPRQGPPPPPPFALKRLNRTQETCAATFLKSEQNSITITQGPPGTGKTTLLVSVICRYLMQSNESTAWDDGNDGESRRRLMVCAPTNKAISVLASRFLAAVNPDTCASNAIIVGDSEKLLSDRDGRLRSIFLYQWMPEVVLLYRKIRNYFLPGGGNASAPQEVYASASQLERKLSNSFPGLPPSIVTLTNQISTALRKFAFQGVPVAPDFVGVVEKLLSELQAIPVDFVWRELLKSADVVFCTLSSAGGVVFKSTPKFDDLVSSWLNVPSPFL